jgi:hypothetical protein
MVLFKPQIEKSGIDTLVQSITHRDRLSETVANLNNLGIISGQAQNQTCLCSVYHSDGLCHLHPPHETLVISYSSADAAPSM